MKLPSLALLLLGAMTLEADHIDRGIVAYTQERHAEALGHFHAALEAAGPDAPAALYYDQALAALALDELELAAASAREARNRDPANFGARAQFMLGNVHYRDSLRAEARASVPGAPAAAFDPALAAIEAARDAWIAAALAQQDWPAARRNVEHALIKRAQLLEAQRVAESNRSVRQPDAAPNPTPSTEPPPENSTSATSEPEPLELSPGQLAELLRALDRVQGERDESRESRRARTQEVEKDW